MVASYLQLIQKRYTDILDDDGREFIKYAIDGAKRMKNLINDLLQFSRIETRGQSFSNINLNTVIEEVKLNLKEQIETDQATIIFDDLPQVFADYGQMIQLFQNLIANGIKFHGIQKPIIKISCEEIKNNQNQETQYLFTVEDNGIGIKQEYYERIFVIFQRLHTQNEIEGTGIGLAIAKTINEIPL
jgi:light-regulated signal transduction histidine kinase (bacteriophytochrome)